ncbi:GyrI-like domain-containing protein [Salipaludibacillus sp. LMS25]|uniref:GyrI-like domain-containing protein n=1 Tax=Salipaludibacillus sp. LMS25 TaxID=2924031 RepID=UPI0020D17EA9|nr:GyrI-like domain-containing protein [Salipaludibacillus sp. LMS25]UTR13308.1 GyrI-like domain-containing protein [Salipaludibacillus sp. LMS25]
MKIRGMRERMIIGLEWSGTFEEAAEGKIHAVIDEVKQRMEEINGKVNPHEFIGVSTHDRRDGFTYIGGWEVDNGTDIPHGMTYRIVPEGDYLIYKHRKDKKISETYKEIKEELQQRGLTPLKPEDIDAFDDIPLKIELHNAEKILVDEPVFEIHIPVAR